MSHLIHTDRSGNRTVSFLELGRYRMAQHKSRYAERKMGALPKQPPIQTDGDMSANLLSPPKIRLILSTATPNDPRSSVLTSVTLGNESSDNTKISQPQRNLTEPKFKPLEKTFFPFIQGKIDISDTMAKLQALKDKRLSDIRLTVEDSLTGFWTFQQDRPKASVQIQKQAHQKALQIANENPINFYTTYQEQYKKALVKGAIDLAKKNKEPMS